MSGDAQNVSAGRNGSPVLEPDAAEYVRGLDDAQLLALGANVQARCQALLNQGVALPVAEIEHHHIIGLLESLVGPEASLRVREWHYTWLDRQLDQTEALVRARLIESGVFAVDSPTR